MRKLFIFIFMMLFALNMFGQIHFYPSLEMGYENRLTSIAWGELGKVYNSRLVNNMFSVFAVQTEWKGFAIYTEYKTYFYPESLFMYDPRQVQYILGGTYSLSIFELRYEHLCSHGVEQKIFTDSYDRISITINFNQK